MATFEENKDGSVTVRLSQTIRVNGEDTDRCTIPVLRGRHMRACPFIAGNPNVQVGAMIDFAATIVQPYGAVDEMTPGDSVAVAGKIADILGKHQATTDAPSQ